MVRRKFSRSEFWADVRRYHITVCQYVGEICRFLSQLVALASLMPIVAGIGGNTGNQTITMIVRAMALQHIQPGSFFVPDPARDGRRADQWDRLGRDYGGDYLVAV